jgi:hypothetical protein
MPTPENPAYYDRASGTAPGRADAFFKGLTPDDAVDETGEVDAPVGYVMLVKVDRDMIAEYVSREGDPWMSERRNFAPGWYIVRHDSNGLVWGIDYGGWCDEHQAFCADTSSEQNARADFAEAVSTYNEWLDFTEDTDEGFPLPSAPPHGTNPSIMEE